MNFLNIRKGPKMQFITGEHRNAFEKEVIDLYSQTNGGFWGAVPSLEADIMEDLNPKYMLAGIYGAITGDLSYYHKETAGRVIPEYERLLAVRELNKLQEEHNVDISVGAIKTMQDAEAVLDYHHMFYAKVVGMPHVQIDEDTAILLPGSNMTGIQGFKNPPIITVW